MIQLAGRLVAACFLGVVVQHILYRDWRARQAQPHRRCFFVFAYLAVVVIDPEDFENAGEILRLVGGDAMDASLPTGKEIGALR